MKLSQKFLLGEEGQIEAGGGGRKRVISDF